MIILFDNTIGLSELHSYLKFIPNKYTQRYFNKKPCDLIITNLSEENKHKLTALTKLASNLLSKTYIDILMPIQKINITILDDNCMFSLPFTLGDTIFFPNKYLSRSNYKNLKTIIHELIHINQRNNCAKWIKWILKNNNDWSLQNFTVCDYQLNDNFILNPDTFYVQSWLYKNKYYSHNVNLNNNIINKWYAFDKHKFIPETNEIHQYDHPFEEYAYKISEELSSFIK